MKHTPTVLPLQKALAFVLALLVFVLAVVVSGEADKQVEHEGERDAFVTTSSIQSTPALPTVSGPSPKAPFVLLALASLWSLLLLLKSFEVQEYQTIASRFFLQKINFVFVSAKAP